MGFNQLDNLPPNIKNLNNLVELDLNSNYLYNFPEIGFGLEKLESIDLSNNCFRNMAIELLKSINYIDLNNNYFNNESLEELKALKESLEGKIMIRYSKDPRAIFQ